METYTLRPIGTVAGSGGSFLIRLEKPYWPALQGLEGFSHIQVLWWCGEFDTADARRVTTTPKPYKTGPEVLGIFATRSPARPNPIALTVARPLRINQATGTITLPYIDAFDGTPVLDIKPYTPSSDRVHAPTVPGWCAHWPASLEASADFDWEAEFTF